jgi:hypothetical protein
MGIDLEEDAKRKLTELHLTAAASVKSAQTGFLHLCYEAPGCRETIPLLENFCHVLALFRSRLADSILEGKALLIKLLAFEVDGNFPIYVHEYPQCKQRTLGLDVAPLLVTLTRDYRACLKEELPRLEDLIKRILSKARGAHAERLLSKAYEARLNALLMPENPLALEPKTAEEWVQGLISSQLLIEPHRRDFFCKALQHWSASLCLYLGEQRQRKGEPEVTLLDLWMGQHFRRYSQRALEAQGIHLRASLVDAMEATHADPSSAVYFLLPPQVLYWGDQDKVHSLSLEMGKDQEGRIERRFQEKRRWEWEISLEHKDLEQDSLVCSVYVDLDAFGCARVEGKRATLFQLGEDVEWGPFSLKVVLEEGKGRFVGHFLRGNRAAQKEKSPLHAVYDGQIALRAIRREGPCKLRITLESCSRSAGL